jgi:hypothetical protein
MILIRGYNYKPDWIIISDVYSGQWIKDYTLAICKTILGEARSKFAQIAGPGGAGGLNGADLKSSGKEEIAALDKELETHIPAGSNGTGYTLIIG